MTDETDRERDRRTEAGKLRTVALGTFLVFAMGALSYAAVPLYQLFCQVTGYGGTTQRATMGSDKVLDRTITVRFDANTNNVPWRFEPKHRAVTTRIGETTNVAYESENLTDAPSGGMATFNVTPELAGAYFNKIQCFCFTEQVLAPGETVDMPIQFFVDPAIVDVPELKDIHTITLSYTFFPLDRDEGQVASASGSDPVQTNSIATSEGN